MSATEADREKARKLIGYHITPHVEAMISLGEDQWAAYVEDVAAALAAEREKARAPFLAVVRNIEAVIPTMDWSHKGHVAGVLDSVVQVLHNAAEADQ